MRLSVAYISVLTPQRHCNCTSLTSSSKIYIKWYEIYQFQEILFSVRKCTILNKNVKLNERIKQWAFTERFLLNGLSTLHDDAFVSDNVLSDNCIS